ncbi:MAG: nuclease-related domain-containing protein [Nocardioidaceae bacterium]
MLAGRPRRSRPHRRSSRRLPRRPRRPGRSVEAIARRHRARALIRLLLAAAAGYAALQAGGDAGRALGAAAVLIALAGAHSWREAGRWGVGVASERAVAGQLRRLERRGWLVLHDLEKRGRGNLDHVAAGPGGVFAIETKTARYRRAHLAQAHDHASWAARRLGLPVTAVLCLARGDGRARLDRGVVVCGAQELTGFLERQPGASGRPDADRSAPAAPNLSRIEPCPGRSSGTPAATQV